MDGSGTMRVTEAAPSRPASLSGTPKPGGRIASVAFHGIEVLGVDVQVQTAGGLPAFAVVGLPDKAVGESRERVRAEVTTKFTQMPSFYVLSELRYVRQSSANARRGCASDCAVGLEAQILMVDTRTPEQRRRIMQSVRQKDTKPEFVVRRLAHSLGHRFRLHRKDLPGRPDVVFPGQKKAIFVHGCFWHGHKNCSKGRLPKTRLEYWGPKIARNKERDAEVIDRLQENGWRVLTIWQCQTVDQKALLRVLKRFLGPKSDRHHDSADVSSPSRKES